MSENIITTLKHLTEDLNTEGWDIPARIYALLGDEADPTPHLMGLMPTHPVEDMQAAYDGGCRIPEGAHGVVIATEALRHLTYEETIKRRPDLLDRFKSQVNESTSLEEVERIAKHHYYEQVTSRLPAPSALPATMRAEIKVTMAVLRNGSTITHTKTRNDDEGDLTTTLDSDMLAGVNVPTAAYLFLHGLRPDRCEDPLTVVSDYRLLEVLSGLPTADSDG